MFGVSLSPRLARLQHFKNQGTEIEQRLREANKALKSICSDLDIKYLDPNKIDQHTEYLSHYIQTDKPVYVITGTVSYKTLNERLLSSRHRGKYPDFTNPRPVRDKNDDFSTSNDDLRSQKLEFYFKAFEHMVDKDIRPLLNGVDIAYLRPGVLFENSSTKLCEPRAIGVPYLSFMGE